MDSVEIWNFFRRHSLELEDNDWFPRRWRTFMTDYLRGLSETLGLYDPVAPLLADALRESPHAELLDLCSGSGGPAPRSRRLVEDILSRKIPLTLSDKYVHLDTSLLDDCNFRHLDATMASPSISGFRTFFTSFHHFPRDAALQILTSAIEEGSGIGVFDITRRSASNFFLVMMTPVHVWLLTPFLKPFSAYRLLMTYVFPVVPLAATWDGIISNLRSYSVDELLSLAGKCDSFQWRAGRIPSRFGIHVTYLIGCPRNSEQS